MPCFALFIVSTHIWTGAYASKIPDQYSVYSENYAGSIKKLLDRIAAPRKLLNSYTTNAKMSLGKTIVRLHC
ncbi:hypothetical protein F5Y16DRAFT_367191 [Xylariaceae sp. FL0255]|nr:hypothetical protein F5Y16DRAFT_367191 [Xylariaceae sp. FL0255]